MNTVVPGIAVGYEQYNLRDNHELDVDIQAEVQRRWSKITTGNVAEFADLRGFREDFFRLFGFGIESVDYDADIDLLTGY